MPAAVSCALHHVIRSQKSKKICVNLRKSADSTLCLRRSRARSVRDASLDRQDSICGSNPLSFHSKPCQQLSGIVF